MSIFVLIFDFIFSSVSLINNFFAFRAHSVDFVHSLVRRARCRKIVYSRNVFSANDVYSGQWRPFDRGVRCKEVSVVKKCPLKLIAKVCQLQSSSVVARCPSWRV